MVRGEGGEIDKYSTVHGEPVMMHEGRIVVDPNHEQKTELNVNDLVVAFEQASGRRFI